MNVRVATILLWAFWGGTGCSTLGYYGQAASGHLEVMAASRPLGSVIEDPATPTKVRERLRVAADARRFASTDLGLPDNGSYRSYADLGRDAVVWALYAAPEFDVEPHRWCYPFVGCLAYRGFFDLDEARDVAKRYAARGMDTYIAPVPAYSTLGWFDDPLLNTMMRWDDTSVAALVFHELAHQVVYVADDTEFNEAFAVTVEREGVRRWLESRGRSAQLHEWRARKAAAAELVRMMLALRADLDALYAGASAHDRGSTPGARKGALIEAVRERFRKQARTRRELEPFAHWFGPGLNNARLNVFAVYERWVPAFAALLAREEGDMSRFFIAVKRLGRLDQEERARQLRELAELADELAEPGTR
ncbi:MAG: aminopeptidase [Gammaproteobacteria bacterium]